MGEFVEYLKEVFVHFGSIQARKMFGGYGIYHKGVMFGLVADDTLYLKADDETAKDFESKGLGPFEYDKGDKVVKMSYYLARTKSLMIRMRPFHGLGVPMRWPFDRSPQLNGNVKIPRGPTRALRVTARSVAGTNKPLACSAAAGCVTRLSF